LCFSFAVKMKYTVLLLLCLAVLCSAFRDRQNKQIIENGSQIFNDGQKLIIKEPSGNITIRDLTTGQQHNKRDSGWIASVWTYSNYTYYSAEWTVPPAPKMGGQILFFFNSFESSQYNDILQPVLQYNNGVSGWTLAAWYGDSAGKYFEATPSPVNVGDTITGVIQLVGNSWQVLGYVNGVEKTSISASYSLVAAQGDAQFAMEVYTISQCSQYPPSNGVKISNIKLQDGKQQMVPSFTKSINTNSCGADASYTTTTAAITWNSGS